MVWCTYCGQEFSRAEHLDRHVMTLTNIKPFKCATCHVSFKRRDLLQHHHIPVHKEDDERCLLQEEKSVQRRPIACVTCARAKTKCDKLLPSCSRCMSKGLLCEARSTKRSSDAAYRLAKRQLSFYRRPIPIAPSDGRSSTPPAFDFAAPSHFFAPNPVQNNLQNFVTEVVTMSTPYQTYPPPAPPSTPSMSASESLTRAPTPFIFDGSDLGSPYGRDGQLQSFDFFGPGLDQYSELPMTYSPEAMFLASFESKEDLSYLQRSNNEQVFGTSGHTSCPSLQITDPQNKTYPAGYQWNHFTTPQYHTYRMLLSRPSSAHSSRYGTLF